MAVATITVAAIDEGVEVPDVSLPLADWSLPGNLVAAQGPLRTRARAPRPLADVLGLLLPLARDPSLGHVPQLTLDAVRPSPRPLPQCDLDECVRPAPVAGLVIVMCLFHPLDDRALPRLGVAAVLCGMRDENVRHQGDEDVLLRLILPCLLAHAPAAPVQAVTNIYTLIHLYVCTGCDDMIFRRFFGRN